MNVDLIFQIAGVGIIVAVLNQLLTRAGRDEQALLTTIAGLVAVLFILSQQIGDLFDTVKNIFSVGRRPPDRRWMVCCLSDKWI